MQRDEEKEIEEQLRGALAAQPISEESEELPIDFDRQTATLAQQNSQIETMSAVLSTDAGDVPSLFEPGVEARELGRLGSYAIIREIGRGGMGIVYEAVDTQLQRRVALKIMSPNVAGKTEHHTRFLREARAAARVEHPHICPIYQVGESGGIFFIAMPFLTGESLDQRLNRGPIPLQEALLIGQQIAKALAAAHQAGLVHRDIKPSNVWIERNADGICVRLLDFGLARRENEEVMVTREGMILGTPAYMAPEQARGEVVDGRADLFSLGVILYEMVTSKRPFEGKDIVMILTKLATHTPIEPSLISPEVPEPVSSFIIELLNKSPDQRPSDAAQVAGQLEKLQRELISFVDPEQANVTAEFNKAAQPTIAIVAPPDDRSENSASTTIADRSNAHSPPGNWIRNGAIVFAFGFGFVLLASIYFMSVKTKMGTLDVEVAADVDLRTRDGKLLIYDDQGELKYTISIADKQQMPPGKYLARIQGADGVELESSEFEMKKDGKVTVRVVAKAPESNPQPAVADSQSTFPGQLLWQDNFENQNQTRFPAMDRPNEIRKVVNGRYDCQFTEGYPTPVAFVSVGPALADGAIHYRSRSLNGDQFLNFRAMNDGKRARWLALSMRQGKLLVVIQRQDREDNVWKQLSQTVLAESNEFVGEVGEGLWVDISARWSKNDYAVWVNGRLAARGTLDDWPELYEGMSQPTQICIRRSGPLTMHLQIDSIELYDQSSLPVEENKGVRSH